LYLQGLPHVTRLYLTRVFAQVQGDAFFPPLEMSEWELVSEEAKLSEKGLQYSDMVYQRRKLTE
jgi:dihydrofolate reductase